MSASSSSPTVALGVGEISKISNASVLLRIEDAFDLMPVLRLLLPNVQQLLLLRASLPLQHMEARCTAFSIGLSTITHNLCPTLIEHLPNFLNAANANDLLS